MPDGTEPAYEVLALRFGVHEGRLARENFLVGAGLTAPDAVVPYDFSVWLIRNENHLILVDTGFTREVAARRGRTIIQPPVDGLSDLGIHPADIQQVVITHMHYDHAGNLGLFPAALVHLQEAEFAFCTGRAMRHPAIRRTFEATDVKAAVQCLFDGRLLLHDGTAEILPGVTLHRVPGHTPGQQVVRVRTTRGWVVLASDAAHLWANIDRRDPFPIAGDVAAMLDGYAALAALADGPDHIIPGHEPQVAVRFPGCGSVPHWVCLHEAPTRGPARGADGGGEPG